MRKKKGFKEKKTRNITPSPVKNNKRKKRKKRKKKSFSFDGQIETPKHFKCGLPQGSPVSPILFLIVANIVIEPPTANPDPTVSYIDDIGMIESRTNYIEITEKLKIRTKEQLHHAEAVGLKLVPDKSELIHCATKGTHHDLSQEDIFPTLVIDNTYHGPSPQTSPKRLVLL
jgi:hypothetical protein